MESYKDLPTNSERQDEFKGYGKRHTQSILIFCCMITSSGVRGCISVAILAMTDSSLHDNKTQTFDWDKPTQGLIMSSYYWGDILMQIPAGYLVCKYGGKPFMTLAAGVSGLSAFLTPIASYYAGWQGTCASRVLLGLSQAFLFPCIHTLLGKWAPISERNRMGIMIYSGINIATIFGSPIAAFIATSPLGWSWIFYMFGIISLLNALVWMVFGANSPAEHKSITKSEKDFIERSLGKEEYDGTKKVPWKSIMTSKPVVALIFSQCCIYSCYNILFFEIPTLFKLGLKIDLESSGILASLPYVASFIFSILCCIAADYLLNKAVFSLNAIRKLFNTLGTWIPALCLVFLMFVQEERKVLAVILVIVIIMTDTLSCAGIMLNHIDLSPNFAGVIVSWAMIMADIGSLLAPIISGHILTDPSDMTRWRTLFLLVAAVYFFGNLIFLLFGSAKIQPWNDINDSPNVVLVPSDLAQELRLLKPSAPKKEEMYVM